MLCWGVTTPSDPHCSDKQAAADPERMGVRGTGTAQQGRAHVPGTGGGGPWEPEPAQGRLTAVQAGGQ